MPTWPHHCRTPSAMRDPASRTTGVSPLAAVSGAISVVHERCPVAPNLFVVPDPR
jgi:hypothetical protein